MNCCINCKAKEDELVSVSEPEPVGLLSSNDDNGDDDLPEVLCLLHLKRTLELYKSTRERLSQSKKENDALFKEIKAMEEEFATSENDLKESQKKSVGSNTDELDFGNSEIGDSEPRLMSDAELMYHIRDVEEENASFMREIEKCKERIRNMESLERDGSERNQAQMERSKDLEATIRNLEMDMATLKENIEKLDRENHETEGSLKKFKQRALVAEVSTHEMDWTVHQLKAQIAALKAAKPKDEAVLQNSSLRKRVEDLEESSRKRTPAAGLRKRVEDPSLAESSRKDLPETSLRKGFEDLEESSRTDPATPKTDEREFAEKASLIEALLAKDVLILKQRENLHKSLGNQEELMELLKIVQNKNKETFSVNMRQLKQAHKADLDAVKECIRMTSIRSPLLKSESGKFKKNLEDMSRLEDGLIHQIEKNEELQMLVVENQQQIARLSRKVEEANIEIRTLRETHDILGWMVSGQSKKRSPSSVINDTDLPYQRFLSPTREAILRDGNEPTSPRQKGRMSPIEVIGSVVKRLISPDRDRDGRDRSLSPRRSVVSVMSSNKPQEETGAATRNVKINVGVRPGPNANERKVTGRTGMKPEIPTKRSNSFERNSYRKGHGKDSKLPEVKLDDGSGLKDSESEESWKSIHEFSDQTRTQRDVTRPKRDGLLDLPGGLSDPSQSKWETDSSYSDVEEELMKGVFEMRRSRRELASKMKTLESETEGYTQRTSDNSDTALQEDGNRVSREYLKSLKGRVTDTTWTEEMEPTTNSNTTTTRKNLEDAFAPPGSFKVLDIGPGIRPPTIRVTDHYKILHDVANSGKIHPNSRGAQETSEDVLMTPGEAVMKLHGNL